MFAIYNKGSVSVRSTADNLYEIKNTEAPSKISLKPDDDNLFQDYLSNENKKKQNNNENQLDVYKKIADIKTSEIVYHVKDVMTKECVSVNIDSSIKVTYTILKENKVSQIPIISNQNKIVGLINKKIILNLLIEDIYNYENILNKRLEELYLDEVITTDPISDIRRVAKVMIDFKLDAIPVVNNKDTLVGIVSKTDIIKAVSNIPQFQIWS